MMNKWSNQHKNRLLIVSLGILSKLHYFSALDISNYSSFRYSIKSFSTGDLSNFVVELILVFTLSFLLGTKIYSLFMYSTPYYFIRQTKRDKWYKSEVFKLFCEVFITWLLLYIFIFIIFSLVDFSHLHCFGGLLLSQFILEVLFSFLLILSINIGSLLFTSHFAMIFVNSFIVGLVLLLNIHDTLLPVTNVLGYIVYFINPVTHLVLNYHLTSLSKINFVSLSESLPYFYSIVYLIILNLIVYYVGKRIVRSHTLLEKGR